MPITRRYTKNEKETCKYAFGVARAMGLAVPAFAAEAESGIKPLEHNDVVEHISISNMRIVEVSDST